MNDSFRFAFVLSLASMAALPLGCSSESGGAHAVEGEPDGSASGSGGDAASSGSGSGTGSSSGARSGSSSGGKSGSGGSSGGGGSGSSSGGKGHDGGGTTGDGGALPFGGSSHGSGGASPVKGATQKAGGISYDLIVPSGYASGTPTPLLIVYSGTEGAQQMTSNLMNLAGTGIGPFICAVLDGVTYYGDGAAGATVLDDVRAKYDVDDDKTYLLGESAGTSAALELGFTLRESAFAAYWANDVNASSAPASTAAQLGFHPWGQAGPGGDFGDASTIVAAMKAAGYRLPSPAPYAGKGAGTHGDLDQLEAALAFFPGKTRQ